MRLIFILSVTTILGCTRLKQNNTKREYYDNGNIKTEAMISADGKENGIKTTYTEDGKILSWSQNKDGKIDGYRLFFYPNGKIKSLKQFISDTANGDCIWFDEEGRLKSYIKYKKDEIIVNTQFDGNGNMDFSSPFMTILPKADTIKIGETYSADITLNYCLEGFTCEIFKRNEKKTIPKTTYYDKIGNCPNASFTITPTKTGEHTYGISYFQKKYYPNRNDSVQYFKEGFYEGKFWVTQ